MTTITKDFDGAVLVLTDATNAETIAERVAKGYFPDSPYHYTVTDATPTSLPAELQAKTAAMQQGRESVVLTVYPWAATESTLPERSTRGQIPS
jgi:hypothetical protein